MVRSEMAFLTGPSCAASLWATLAFVHTHVVSRLTQTQADGGQWLALAVAARAKD